jgi:hypothetical protein
MKFDRVHEYPAPADRVLAMLLDEDFRELVCRAQEAQSCSVDVSASQPPATVRVALELSMDGAPPAARKVTGSTVRTEQEETWDSPASAALRIVIPGKPGRLTGRISLTDNGDGTSTTTRGPGAPYPAKEVVHRYADAQVTVSHRVVVTWTAQWSLNGGPLRPVNGTVTTTGPATALRVAEASPSLSGQR